MKGFIAGMLIVIAAYILMSMIVLSAKLDHIEQCIATPRHCPGISVTTTTVKT